MLLIKSRARDLGRVSKDVGVFLDFIVQFTVTISSLYKSSYPQMKRRKRSTVLTRVGGHLFTLHVI